MTDIIVHHLVAMLLSATWHLAVLAHGVTWHGHIIEAVTWHFCIIFAVLRCEGIPSAPFKKIKGGAASIVLEQQRRQHGC